MNPENVDDTSRNIASQNPDQSTTNQNATFSGQNLQPAQSQFAQNLRPRISPLKPKKSILIACIVGAIIVIIAITCVVRTIVMQTDSNNDLTDNATSDITDNPEEDVAENVTPITTDATVAVDVEKFKQMTKAEVIAFLQARQSASENMPKNYVGEEIINSTIMDGNVIISDLQLVYSYDTLDDLRQIVEKKYNGPSFSAADKAGYEIKEYDYYAIVTPNRIKGATTCDHGYYRDCNSLLSFKREYLNHFLEETSPSSFNDVFYFNTRDSKIIEYLLRVCTFFADGGPGNIYGSSFEEQDDKFVLTVYYVGIGFNVEKIKVNDNDMGYAINLYSRQYATDKADGRLYVIQTGENSTTENIKSIPITEEEAKSLLSMYIE